MVSLPGERRKVPAVPRGRRRLVVSLTAIPPRFSLIGPALRSLLSQSVRPDEIALNLPDRYMRFPGHHPDPDVPEGVSIHRVGTDLGPATKILPTLRRLEGIDANVVYVDDDMVHDRRLLARLLAGQSGRPDDAICERGANLDVLTGLSCPPSRTPLAGRRGGLGGGWRYRLVRFATLGFAKPKALRLHANRPGYVQVAEGFGGVLIRSGMMPREAFDPPPVAVPVDDIWLSGMLEKAGVGIWVGPRVAHKQGSRARPVAALADATFDGQGRVALNRACALHLAREHGVWPGLLDQVPERQDRVNGPSAVTAMA
ncbi:MAG: glycosyltransferase family 2 protein [Rubricella sp.]